MLVIIYREKLIYKYIGKTISKGSNKAYLKYLLLSAIGISNISYSALDPAGDADGDGIPNSIEGAFVCTDPVTLINGEMSYIDKTVNIPNNSTSTAIARNGSISVATDITDFYDVSIESIIVYNAFGDWIFDVKADTIEMNNSDSFESVSWQYTLSKPVEFEVSFINPLFVMNAEEEYIIGHNSNKVAVVDNPLRADGAANQLNIVSNNSSNITFRSTADLPGGDATWKINILANDVFFVDRLDFDINANAGGLKFVPINHPCSTYDTDGDGIPDSIEAGANPLIPVDTDRDGIPDYREPGQAAFIANLNPIPSMSIFSMLGLFGLLGYLGIYRRK